MVRGMSLSASYFEQLYATSSDPWSLASRWYEARKYALTMASLPRRQYRRGFEPGSSVGELTALLAQRCDQLLSVDIAAAAVAATRERVADLPNVEVAQLNVPDQWPTGSFDLIVLSEVGYYLDAAALRVLVDRSVESLESDGSLVAVHWRHPVADYPLGGDQVHEAIGADDRLVVLAHHEELDFRLDVFVRAPLVSVAAAAGLVTP
jgi:SAM-dependent methyltransferase